MFLCFYIFIFIYYYIFTCLYFYAFMFLRFSLLCLLPFFISLLPDGGFYVGAKSLHEANVLSWSLAAQR